MHRELTPAQSEKISQEFLTRKGSGNQLRRGAINMVDRICGASRYTVWRICKQEVEAQENGNDYYASESRKYNSGRQAKEYSPEIRGMPRFPLAKRGTISELHLILACIISYFMSS